MSGDIGVQFSPGSLVVLNVVIAFMMFGVSLTLKTEDFVRVLRTPKAPVAGLFTQFLLLPALTCLATWALKIEPELALGMMLVASCPGGAFSNVMTWLARGSVATSVSMTAISSLTATVMTPLNFSIYAKLNPYTRPLYEAFTMDSGDILILVLLVLGLPIVLGMAIGKRFPKFAIRSERPLRTLSLLVFLVFIGIAFGNNFELFISKFNTFFWLVVAHNTGALIAGYLLSRMLRLSQSDLRAVTLETGIQNSGLGLVIIFSFMPEAGGMMLIAAFWGVWHLVSGLTLANIWARSPITDGSEATFEREAQALTT